MSKQEIIDRAYEAVTYAKGFIDDIEFSAEDAMRTEPEYLVEVFNAAIAAGSNDFKCS
jgi:2-isopropylmalate synthase